jgi:hypothetical protein
MKLTLLRLRSSAPFAWELLTIASAAIGKYEAKRYWQHLGRNLSSPPGEIELRTKALLPSVNDGGE